MLHLNRKKNEVIHLIHNETGQTIDVVVLEIRGRTVKLGFEDDTKSHTVLRKEVRQAQQQCKDPNPYYKDRKPTPPKSHAEIHGLPLLDMREEVDGLEKLVDELIPTTQETPTPTAA